ncbi:hypothetical protein JOF36_002271 [Pseudonocardia parietis]|uniref:Uncharacterized protein n=1 Tax=Pseudonocardia parietis TaxID=570936 RepID=A0ABS4VRK7_9PSEU|nr:hypothetical protein [Pseudonocardia parietis]
MPIATGRGGHVAVVAIGRPGVRTVLGPGGRPPEHRGR